MEFYVCFTDFGHPSQQCKSDENSERLDGGGYLTNYLAHRNVHLSKFTKFYKGTYAQESFQHCAFMRHTWYYLY